MITLYHGSNCEVRKPDPKRGRFLTDFGQGFYLTPDMNEARAMAERTIARTGEGRPVISAYSFDAGLAGDFGLRVKTLNGMDLEWMNFVIANRNCDRNAPDHNLDSIYDVVIGFIADDRIRRLMILYQQGLISADAILARMKDQPWRVMQYSFHTARAVKFLKLKEVWNER